MPSGVQRADDIAPAFGAFKGQVDAIYLVENALIDGNRTRIVALALDAKLPDERRIKRICQSWGSRVLWTELPGYVPARRRDR